MKLLQDGHGIRETTRMVGASPSSVVRWQDAEMPCTVSHTVRESAKFDAKRDPARQCGGAMGDTGLEPVTSRV